MSVQLTLSQPPPLSPRRVMLDVDGILFPFTRAFSTRLGDGPVFEEDECPAWQEYPRPVEARMKGIAMNWAHQGETILRFGLYPGAAEGVQRLRQAGLEIHVCSRRAGKHAQSTHEALLKLGLPPLAGYHASPRADKLAYCLEYGCGVCVDDKPETLLAVSDAGLQAFSLRWRYNQHLEGRARITLCRDWPELSEQLLLHAQAGAAQD